MRERKIASAVYDALTIAKWFVAWAVANDAELSNLKLQKLLYYAQGHHLGNTGRPLFRDAIQAWSHGPVVEDVYHNFKGFGASDLRLDTNDSFDWGDVDETVTQFLIEVWEKYGSLAAWRLRNMTHAEPPWQNHFDQDARNIVIPHQDLEKYFRRLAPRT